MICKKKKNKYIYAFLLSLILVCGLLQSSVLSCNSYASSSSITVGDYLSSNNFYDVCAYFCRGFASFPDPYGGGTGFTYQAFADYLEEKEKSDVLQQTVAVIENESSGGRGYDLPQEARQEIINFVNETYIEQNPLGYSLCYIPSYNFMNASVFPTYQMYTTVKEYIKNHDGYSFFITWDISYGNVSACHVFTLSHDLNLGWVGTTNQGIFTNVHPYINWQILQTSNLNSFVSSKVKITANGDIQTSSAGIANNTTFSNANGLSASGSPTAYMTYTSFDKNELVYVFDTLNAYKNYNAGLPQSYYLLTDGSNIAPLNDYVTESQLQSAGNFYNNIVNNLSTGKTPDQVQTVVKETLQGKSSNGSSSDSEFDLGFLGTIGEVIKSVTGAFTPVNGLINGELSDFISDVFGWLPQEIVILWVAGIIFAVLFGILKLIRG